VVEKVVVVVVDVVEVEVVLDADDAEALVSAFGEALSPHALVARRQARAATAQRRRGRTGRA